MKHHLRAHELDASALVRFFTKGPGWESVKRVLDRSHEAAMMVRMSVVNCGYDKATRPRHS